jgi:hypothetical protein
MMLLVISRVLNNFTNPELWERTASIRICCIYTAS